MTRTGLVAATAVLTSAFFAPPPFQGGDLARRIASAPDGLVKMTLRVARRHLWRRPQLHRRRDVGGARATMSGSSDG